MTPVWLEGELLLVRRADVDGAPHLQGAWLDWPGPAGRAARGRRRSAPRGERAARRVRRGVLRAPAGGAAGAPLHRAAVAADPGVGLGLALAARLAREMRGSLALAPAERGATFVLELPAAPDPSQSRNPAAA
jgi:hypothetical protein